MIKVFKTRPDLLETIQCLLDADTTMKYKLLDRLRMDCEYYIQHPHPKHLWAGDPTLQLASMRYIYSQFTKSERPEWLTKGQLGRLHSLIRAI